MNLSELDEITFKLRVTRVERREIDRLIDLANEFSKTTQDRALSLLEKGELSEAFSGLAESGKTQFCLYCLAIINCYAFLENNRNEILGKELSTKKEFEAFIKNMGIVHNKVRCHKTMDEFRLVNNAIKHTRLSGATKITVKQTGKTYGPKQIIALYRRARFLDSYLADLFRIVEGTSVIQRHDTQ